MLDNTYPVTSSFYLTSTDESVQMTSDSIWNSLRKDLKLNHMIQSPRVQAEISKLVADQEKLYSILKAAGPYLYYIYHETQQRKLPAEIALIPVIESEYNPNDRSNKGATGLWQLMPQTARELGVQVKSGYDGRRNVIDSTRAALAYFKDLGNNFNDDWYLAIAAYNCGQGKVENVSRHSGSNSFWDMKLPNETKHYVPKLLAVAEIVKNPDKYGVKLPKIVNKPYFEKVASEKPVNLKQVAETSGVNIKTLNTLNPDYNHGTPPPKSKKHADTNAAYSVLMPVNQAKDAATPQLDSHQAPGTTDKQPAPTNIKDLKDNANTNKKIMLAVNEPIKHDSSPSVHKKVKKRHSHVRHHTRHIYAEAHDQSVFFALNPSFHSRLS